MKFKSKNKLLSKSSLSVLDGSKAYAQLRETITKEGILKRSYWFYFWHITISVSLFVLSLYKLFTAETTLMTIFWSIFVALFAVQVSGGNMHEGAHRAIAKSTFWNDFIGRLAVAPFGVSYSYWKDKHNAHHANPNEEDEDPDLKLPILSFTKERYEEKTGIERALRKYQVYLFYPIGLLVFISLRTESLKYYLANLKLKLLPEFIVFILGCILWFGFPFYFFPLSKAIVSFLVLNFATGFYLFNIFAPNHKGMPHLKKGTKISFFEQQVITSRNIYGNWLIDYLYLGLNYQIEHHLFPNCPRNRLKDIRPHLIRLCRKMKLDYTEVSVFDTNRIILGELHQIVKSSRS